MSDLPPPLALGPFTLAIERFPIAGEFRIARGAKTHADVLVASVRDGEHVGRGEAVPYARYGESPASVLAAAAALGEPLARASDRVALAAVLGPGALRNALELALFDLEARRRGVSVDAIVGTVRSDTVPSALTLSLAAPEAMARAATACPGRLLKLKLAGDGIDPERLRAVHEARPDAQLWLDANEGLDADGYLALVPLLDALPVVLLEQPLPAGRDAVLATLPRPVPLCADESAHDVQTLDALVDRYDVVNVKLDKTGGLGAALATIDRAHALGLGTAVGCMVCTSLALAPLFLLTHDADFADLDGALFLARDREGGVRLDAHGLVHAPSRALWGG